VPSKCLAWVRDGLLVQRVREVSPRLDGSAQLMLTSQKQPSFWLDGPPDDNHGGVSRGAAGPAPEGTLCAWRGLVRAMNRF